MKKALKYKKRKSTTTQTPETMAAEIQLGSQIMVWEDYIYSKTIETVTGTRVAPIWGNGGNTRIPSEHQAGRVYHLFIHAGLLEHISGFDAAIENGEGLRHYLEVTPTWWNTEHHINTIDVLDEEGKVTGTTNESIKNSEQFHIGAVVRDTKILVKITDANYLEVKELFVYDVQGKPTMVVCENKYDEWLIDNPAPIVEEEI